MDIDLSLFPSNWDIDNEEQFNYYKKCLPYMESEEDFDNIIQKSSLFKFIGIIVIHLPQISEVLIFLIIFLPLALIEVLKFDDTFKMKKKIIYSILLTFLCFIGFITFSSVKQINCSIIVKYIPSDTFAILLFLFSSIFLCVPTFKDIIYVENQKSETKATTNGMLKMLEDEILLREFSEFCRKENCAENILFYQHYWRYKKIFDNQRNSKIAKSNNYHNINSNIIVTSTYDYEDHDLVSQMSFDNNEASIYVEDNFSPNLINGIKEAQSNSDNDMSKKKYSNNGRKITKNDILLKEAKKLIDDFINTDSKLEINIKDKTKKKIIYDFSEIKNNELQQQDFKNRLKSLFDDAYKEVIESLFLNSYNNYIILKKNKKLADSMN
ncbi:hypothetical protein LY90DRAFT_664666 [Neocallimastix californiae]|uniref:RGS domain-containing protein n=1 Tax=Neocallimastix californiae TaxID=1754190 RepID=A0A1Y2F6U6_9FUNG|nr:hypothetical protein LY90DRAFT_664666 [Neocallimastix californiae]|eukprot:ORY79601.1 hypothetical protein LY90DRAFT_664666 [Neocallimastix californiae]